MKRNINYYIIGGLMTLGLTATSCSSDYLDTTPTASVGTVTTFQSTENVKLAINGIAEVMATQQYWWGQGFNGEGYIKIRYGEYPGPNYYYNRYASGWKSLMNAEFNSRTSSIYCAYGWYYYYTIIGNANSIILHVDEATGTEADKQFLKAQALTFRAYGYEQLIQLYTKRWQDTKGADKVLPLRLDESTGDLAASSTAEVYTQIYKDLDEAIALFNKSGKDRNASDVWLPNLNVAHATYARAAINHQDYANALTHAKLARNGYPLMSNTEYVSGFAKPTSEWIWGSYGDETENQWYYSYGTHYACNGYYSGKYDTGAGAIDRFLINRIPNNDVRKSLFLTEDKFPDWNVNKTINSYGYIKIAEANYPLLTEIQNYITKMTPKGYTPAYKNNVYYLDGQLKFWVFGAPGVSYLPHFRSSEMVLIEAEANYFLGKTADAQASLIELNKTSGRNPDYTCTKTGDDLFQEIVDYRGLELFGEGFSWYDYKRWNKDMTRKTFSEGGNAHLVLSNTIKATDNNGWTWSVPQAETDYNSSLQ